jgi:hypothetical protein
MFRQARAHQVRRSRHSVSRHRLRRRSEERPRSTKPFYERRAGESTVDLPSRSDAVAPNPM